MEANKNIVLKKSLRMCSAFLLILWTSMLQAQIKSGIQISLSGGMSSPVGKYKNPDQFTGSGMHFSGGMDYYFFKGLGLGIEGGYFENRSERLFEDFIYRKYFEVTNISSGYDWQTMYITAGPTLKWSPGRFELDLTGKMGVSQISAPNLLYQKNDYGEVYDVYRFTRGSKDWKLAWSTGLRAIYKLNYWMGVQGKLDYWSTMGLNSVNYSYRYRDVIDLDRNGHLDSEEFHHAGIVSKAQTTAVNVLNLDLGLVFQIGNIYRNTRNNISMDLIDAVLDDEEKLNSDSILLSQQNINVISTDTSDVAVLKSKVEQTGVMGKDSINNTTDARDSIESQHVNMVAKDNVVIGRDSINSLAEIHFSMTDYNKAAEYYNLLKDDPEYPRSRYMYALSLSFNGQCDEARKEFKQFMREYTGSDKRSLEVLFVSQFENCTSVARKIKSGKVVSSETSKKSESGNNTDNLVTDATKATESTDKKVSEVAEREYQVQFIAIHKAGVIFQSMLKMGSVNIEFIKDKKLYRYSLTGYQYLEEAVKDLQKVRSMGYSDAFIAMYQNGKRMDTMYHDNEQKE